MVCYCLTCFLGWDLGEISEKATNRSWPRGRQLALVMILRQGDYSRSVAADVLSQKGGEKT